MKTKLFARKGAFAFAAVVSLYASLVFASGARPDTPLVIMSEANGQAQLGVSNTENFPLLLNTTVIDLPEDDAKISVLVWPPISRLEANQRQVIRFVLDKPPEPLKVQVLKRVSLEGLAPKSADAEASTVRVNIRTTLPLVISPKGLEQITDPWTKLEFLRTGSRITVSNPSPFVVRMQPTVQLLPSLTMTTLFERAYVLPGESMTVVIPEDVLPRSVTGLRLYPASPWGFAVDPYEVELPAVSPAA